MKIIIQILAILWSTSALSQLVPIQDQYMFNGIAINPAMAGNENSFSVLGSLRSQWTGFPGAPKTENLSFHAPLKKIQSAVGFQVYADQIGVDRNTGLFGMYAYRIPLGTGQLSFGISAGFNFVKSFYSRLDVIDTEDAIVQVDSPLGIMPDFSFGTYYATEKYFISFSLPGFLSHTFDGQKFRVKNDFSAYNFTLGGGYQFDINEKISLRPSLLAKYNLSGNFQLDINLFADLSPVFSTGLSYRTQESLVFLFKLNPTEQLSFMYSFGLPQSQFLNHSFGSHELAIKYNFMFKTNMSNPRMLSW